MLTTGQETRSQGLYNINIGQTRLSVIFGGKEIHSNNQFLLSMVWLRINDASYPAKMNVNIILWKRICWDLIWMNRHINIITCILLKQKQLP